MTRDGVTINELSKMANVTVRTIRFYTDEGVLDEPAGRDRYARYTRRHYLQLNTARALKERFYPLRVIRDKMASMSDSELEQLGGPVPDHIEARFAETQVSTYALPTVANSFTPLMNMIKPLNLVASMAYHQMPPQLQSDDTVHEVIASGTMAAAPHDPSRERPMARPVQVGDVWHRIMVSPGIELHVRDDAMLESAGEIRRIMASMRKR